MSVAVMAIIAVVMIAVKILPDFQRSGEQVFHNCFHISGSPADYLYPSSG